MQTLHRAIPLPYFGRVAKRIECHNRCRLNEALRGLWGLSSSPKSTRAQLQMCQAFRACGSVPQTYMAAKVIAAAQSFVSVFISTRSWTREGYRSQIKSNSNPIILHESVQNLITALFSLKSLTLLVIVSATPSLMHGHSHKLKLCSYQQHQCSRGTKAMNTATTRHEVKCYTTVT